MSGGVLVSPGDLKWQRVESASDPDSFLLTMLYLTHCLGLTLALALVGVLVRFALSLAHTLWVLRMWVLRMREPTCGGYFLALHGV